jgi:hypothetical protein
VFGSGAEARLELPEPREDALRGTQLFGRPAGGLDLPGAEAPAMPSLGSVRPGRPDPAERALAEAVARRNRRGVWLVIGLLALAGGVWGVQAWLAGRSEVPTVVRAEADSAFALVRRDDAQARANALKTLDMLVTRNPRWVGAGQPIAGAHPGAGRPAALLKRALADADQLTTQLARLEAERTPSDWRTQADGARTRLVALKKQTDPMIDAVNTLEARG